MCSSLSLSLLLTVPKSTCPVESRVRLTDQTGYLPVPGSFGTSAGGGQRCPWQVTVDGRQKIKFWLYTFGTSSTGGGSGSGVSGGAPMSGSSSGGCPVTMMFEDGPSTREERLCRAAGGGGGGGATSARQTLLYTSRGGDVIAYVKYFPQSYDRTTPQNSYLVYYEGRYTVTHGERGGGLYK